MSIKHTQMQVGDKIREQLKYHNMSQFDLADALGTSQTTVSFWVTNKHTPRHWAIQAMAKLFNCSEEYLLGMFD